MKKMNSQVVKKADNYMILQWERVYEVKKKK
jgi:hypothetical protein